MCFKCILNIGGTPQVQVYRKFILQGINYQPKCSAASAASQQPSVRIWPPKNCLLVTGTSQWKPNKAKGLSGRPRVHSGNYPNSSSLKIPSFIGSRGVAFGRREDRRQCRACSLVPCCVPHSNRVPFIPKGRRRLRESERRGGAVGIGRLEK